MENLNNFELADNVDLVAQRRSDMQSKLDDLANRSSAAGLTINVNMSKTLDVNTVNPSGFTVAGQSVDNIESFQYLGSQMAADGGTKIDKNQEGEGLYSEIEQVDRNLIWPQVKAMAGNRPGCRSFNSALCTTVDAQD